MLGLSSLSCALVLADMVEEQSSEEGAKVQLTVCTASLHTHTSCLDKAARDRSTLYFTKHSRHKVTCAVHHRPGLSQKLSIVPVPPALPTGERRPHTGPHHLHVGDGALCRPFLLSLNHLLHQCTMPSIIGNHDYNTRGILHGRHIHPCQQFPLT